MRRALPTLVAILERETRGGFLHFRERLIAELRAQKMPDEDIERVTGVNPEGFFSKYFWVSGSERCCYEGVSAEGL
mgnify:FL=1